MVLPTVSEVNSAGIQGCLPTELAGTTDGTKIANLGIRGLPANPDGFETHAARRIAMPGSSVSADARGGAIRRTPRSSIPAPR